MRTLSAIAVAILAAWAVTPVSAKTAACTGENMAKLEGSVEKMPDSPRRYAISREMGMTNTEMSKGNMRAACMHYMKAETMNGGK